MIIDRIDHVQPWRVASTSFIHIENGWCSGTFADRNTISQRCPCFIPEEVRSICSIGFVGSSTGCINYENWLISAVTTLQEELDKLRKNICYDCKKKLVPGSVLAPTLSSPSNRLNASTTPTASTSSPFWHRMFKGRLLSPPPIDNAASGTDNPPVPVSIPEISLSTPATNSGSEQASVSSSVSTEPDSEPPKFSVVYNPEVKRALDLHLAHVFTQEPPTAFSLKISPDGQRIAVGCLDSGKTVISDVKTRLNTWSVSEYLVSNQAWAISAFWWIVILRIPWPYGV